MNIVVLVVDGMFDTGLAAVLDTLATANQLSSQLGVGAHFSVRVVGVREQVKTQQGFIIPSEDLSTVEPPDLVVMPAMGCITPHTLGDALQRPDVGDAITALQNWYDGGAQVAAACTGTYILAASGLLDGLRATTTWWLCRDFRSRFPAVDLDETQMVISEGGRITAGAALAHVDLALWFVRQFSPNLARTTSNYLLLEGRASQATYSMSDHLAHSDPIVERFEQWARKNLRVFDMSEAARAVGASERTLQRRVGKVLGRTPIAYVRDLRVEQAIVRLETTDESVETIAQAVGYQDGVTLRTLLRDRTGRGIRELRRRGET